VKDRNKMVVLIEDKFEMKFLGYMKRLQNYTSVNYTNYYIFPASPLATT
jgi:hypothetical protein